MSFSIGPHVIDPPYLLAPMAQVSEMPFRVLCFEMGAGLCTTELISAKGIFHKNRRTLQYMTFDEEKERPYSLQLFGGEEESMAVACQEAMRIGADIVDVNMGCPVKKVTKTGAGSAFLTDPKRAARLVEVMREAVEDAIPITVKIRSGWDADSVNCVEMAKHMEGAGCAALAVHARTKTQGYAGKADWSLIRAMKQAVKMPIIGNGDVVTVKDAHAMFEETGCDAVMIGRGALGNPWIFKSLKEGRDCSPSNEERTAFILRHLTAHVNFHGAIAEKRSSEKKTLKFAPEELAIRSFRQHLVWYSRGLTGGSGFRKEAMTLETMASVTDAVQRFFLNVEGNALAQKEDDGINYKQAFG
ncbi:MAG: tRNA dihydrouridine synthase DusB [Deltaproteobacteria bacterium]|nr:tRNA dihydrouridine synthase DusB [Deltaproteobacteria bacterium]